MHWILILPDTGYPAFKKYLYFNKNSPKNTCLHFSLQHCSVFQNMLLHERSWQTRGGIGARRGGAWRGGAVGGLLASNRRTGGWNPVIGEKEKEARIENAESEEMEEEAGEGNNSQPTNRTRLNSKRSREERTDSDTDSDTEPPPKH